jgi:UDP-N-acetylmuramoylalanine--D-glutamate ligase
VKVLLKNLEKYGDDPIAILGAGISGNGMSELLQKLGWQYEMYDEQGRAFCDKEACACSIVVCSPGFKKDHPWRKIAENNKKLIVNEIDFASCFMNSQIIGITGTNGKTSLATFLSHLWNSVGRSAVVAGNIGVPLSKLIAEGLSDETTVFLETSSFQGEDLKFIKLNSLMWTNFEEDHLDYHGSIHKYFLAKANMFSLLGNGSLFVGKTVKEYAENNNYKLPRQTEVVNKNADISDFLKNNNFMSSFPQRENLALAYTFAISTGVKHDDFNMAIKSYEGQPHRLQKIDTIGMAQFWNDSKATNFSSAVAACRNFNGNTFWIGGGKEKGGLVEDLARKLMPLIKKAFLIGESGMTLAKFFEKHEFPNVLCYTLEEAIKKAFSEVTEKTMILFSPGFASFDSFSNYADRGNSFKKLVLDLKRVTSIASHDRVTEFHS